MAAFFITWVMHLLIVILRLMCNYVRRIGLFLITGYCSNTTSCTEKHCELKSNKVCHCYRGKLLSFFFFFQVCILTFPGMLPAWIKCTAVHLSLTGNMWKIKDKCVSSSRKTFFCFHLYYIGFCGLVSEQSSTVFSPQKCVKSVTKDAHIK